MWLRLFKVLAVAAVLFLVFTQCPAQSERAERQQKKSKDFMDLCLKKMYRHAHDKETLCKHIAEDDVPVTGSVGGGICDRSRLLCL